MAPDNEAPTTSTTPTPTATATRPPTRTPTVLVVGSGGRAYREYLIASAAQRAPLWLLEATEPAWQDPYIAGATVVALADAERLVPDQAALISAAAQLAAERPVAGVFTYDETLVVATSHIAEQLGLPGLSVLGAENCRNKLGTRRALTEAGIAQPRFGIAEDLAQARAAARHVGMPAVVKPRGMGGSIGVVRVADVSELESAFEVAAGAARQGNPSYEGGVLVEEFLDGPEISVDGAVHDGEYHPLFLARKRVGLAPYFEEVGHVLDAEDPLASDPDLLAMLSKAHKVLGVENGITHTEVKLTARGPVIVEVNGRLGGDLIPYLGRLATGIDPAYVAVDVATGNSPQVKATHASVVGIRFLYPPRNGVIRTVHLPEPGTSPGLVQSAPMVAAGATLRLPPEGYMARYGYVICEGDTPEAVEAALDAAAAQATVELDPLPA